MKTGRNLHVPKSNHMKQGYRKYINTLDYEPTVDERLEFNQTNKSGEEFASVDTDKKRPADLSDTIKDHFSNHWIVWILLAVSAGIMYLVYDSKVAITRYETILMTHKDKLNNLKISEGALQKNDHSQDLKIQKNDILLDQIQKDISQTEMKIDRIISSQPDA